jgi:hypothetical protein
MALSEQAEILRLLDIERQTVVYPGTTVSSDKGVIRNVFEDGKGCFIAYSSSAEHEIDAIIENEIQTARDAGYELEWKLYGHDHPACLAERLTAGGFEAGDVEQFMVLRATPADLDRFRNDTADIRRVTDKDSLRDYQVISEEIHGESRDQEIERYRVTLENHPNNLSVYVAYIDEKPAACGRVYFHEDSQFAGLYGGQTRERFRKRGLFTQLVGTRVREAISRGVAYVCVDALPTSEPILRKLGFEIVTYTQPFCLPASING